MKKFLFSVFSEPISITRFERILIHALLLGAIAPAGYFASIFGGM